MKFELTVRERLKKTPVDFVLSSPCSYIRTRCCCVLSVVAARCRTALPLPLLLAPLDDHSTHHAASASSHSHAADTLCG